MSNMNGNPHYEDAARYVNEASSLHDWPDTERPIIAANAQALSTLALAYEQRTANLIATLRVGAVDMTDWPQPVIDNFHRTSQEIAQRMGYPAETTPCATRQKPVIASATSSGTSTATAQPTQHSRTPQPQK